jgi:hypothetical protein
MTIPFEVLRAAMTKAEKSRMLSRHGAVLFDRHEIHCCSYNDYHYRKPSTHAEEACLEKWLGLRSLGLKKPKLCNKRKKMVDLLVIRLDAMGRLTNSQPCEDCANMIHRYPVDRIFFSVNAHEIVWTRAKHFISHHQTSCKRYRR